MPQHGIEIAQHFCRGDPQHPDPVPGQPSISPGIPLRSIAPGHGLRRPPRRTVSPWRSRNRGNTAPQGAPGDNTSRRAPCAVPARAGPPESSSRGAACAHRACRQGLPSAPSVLPPPPPLRRRSPSPALRAREEFGYNSRPPPSLPASRSGGGGPRAQRVVEGAWPQATIQGFAPASPKPPARTPSR